MVVTRYATKNKNRNCTHNIREFFSFISIFFSYKLNLSRKLILIGDFFFYPAIIFSPTISFTWRLVFTRWLVFVRDLFYTAICLYATTSIYSAITFAQKSINGRQYSFCSVISFCSLTTGSAKFMAI